MTRKKLSLCTLIAIGLAPLASMNLATAQDAMPTNDYWWPNQLDLQPLRMHSPESDPMGNDFDYAEAFASLDLDAVIGGIRHWYEHQQGQLSDAELNPSYKVVQDKQQALAADLASKRQALAEQFMKANAERFAPSGGKGFMKSDSEFFHSGTSGKWIGHLNDAEFSAYDAMMDAHLTSEARAWLEYGDAKRAAS